MPADPGPESSVTAGDDRRAEIELAILRYVARHAAEDLDSRGGWCRWGYDPDNDPWTWDDYRPLVADGLLERQETWKDILLRLTPKGWNALVTDRPAQDSSRHEQR